MESLKVKDYMNNRPICFTEQMSVAEAVEKLVNGNQSGGPVLNKNKQVIGFLSEQDCIIRMLESTYYRETVASVGEFMIREVKSVKPYDSVLELAQAMARTRPRIYPVVDDDGILKGIITRHDVMVAIEHHAHEGYLAVS